VFGIWSKRPKTSPRFFTADYVTGHAPLWQQLLGGLKGRPGLAGLEVGSLEGRSAVWFLENVFTGVGARFHCVDTFTRPVPAIDGAPATALERLRANIAPWRDRVLIHVGKSADILGRLAPGFDFIYIDATHAAPSVLSDGVMALRLLKCGGLLLFDDYEWPHGSSPAERPKIAIDAIMACFAGRYELVHRGYQVALRKTADLSVSVRSGRSGAARVCGPAG